MPDWLGVLVQRPFWPDGAWILFLTGLLDTIDLSFGRILWFARTIRFWLYFLLHYGLSCLAAFLLAEKLEAWYLLGVAGTFLGVGVLANADIKIGGQSLVPVGQLFTTLKAKVIEQAAEDKAAEVARAEIVERLQKLTTPTLEGAFRAAYLAAGLGPDRIQADLERARRRQEPYLRDFLIHKLIEKNQRFAEERIAQWEAGKTS